MAEETLNWIEQLSGTVRYEAEQANRSRSIVGCFYLPIG
jgi:hypothetical protein